MALDELIGFVITLLALLFLFFKNRHVTVRQEKHPQSGKRRALMEEEREEEYELKELIHTFKGQLKREKEAPLPPPPLQKQKSAQALKKKSLSTLEEYHLSSPIEKRQVKSSLESRQLKSSLAQREISGPLIYHFEERKSKVPSRASNAMTRLAHWPDIVIYTEILSPPKSMRPD